MKHAKELEGMALDWAVAMAEGLNPVVSLHPVWPHEPRLYCDNHEGRDEWSYDPSENWAKGGPLIERYGIGLIHNSRLRPHPHGEGFQAMAAYHHGEACEGSTALIAVCRAIVAYKFPTGIEIPKELSK